MSRSTSNDSDVSCSFDDLMFGAYDDDQYEQPLPEPPLETPPHSPCDEERQALGVDSIPLDDDDLGDSPFRRSNPLSAVQHSRQALQQWKRWRCDLPRDAVFEADDSDATYDHALAASAPERAITASNAASGDLDPVLFGYSSHAVSASTSTATSTSGSIDNQCNNVNGSVAMTKSPGTERRLASQRKNRCAVCRKRLALLGFNCACGGKYCTRHRTGLREAIYGRTQEDATLRGHLCAYDRAEEHANRLASEMNRTLAQRRAAHGYSETI